MAHDVFISYSHKDTAFAALLERQLAPWVVYRDQSTDSQKRLSGLDDWDESLCRAMREATLAVLLLSVNCADAPVPTPEEIAEGVMVDPRGGERIRVSNASSVAAEYRYFAREIEKPWVVVMVDPRAEIDAAARVSGARETLVQAVAQRHAIAERAGSESPEAFAVRAGLLIRQELDELHDLKSMVAGLLSRPGDDSFIELAAAGARVVPAVSEVLAGVIERGEAGQGLVAVLQLLTTPGVAEACATRDRDVLVQRLEHLVRDWRLSEPTARTAVWALARLGSTRDDREASAAVQEWRRLLPLVPAAAASWSAEDGDADRTRALLQLLTCWALAPQGSVGRIAAWRMLVESLDAPRVPTKSVNGTAFARWLGRSVVLFATEAETHDLVEHLGTNPRLAATARKYLETGVEGAMRMIGARPTFSEPATYHMVGDRGARSAHILGFAFTRADLERTLKMLEVGLLRPDPEKWSWGAAPQSLDDVSAGRDDAPPGQHYAFRWRRFRDDVEVLLEPKQVLRLVHYAKRGYAPNWDFSGGKEANTPLRRLYDEDPIVRI